MEVAVIDNEDDDNGDGNGGDDGGNDDDEEDKVGRIIGLVRLVVGLTKAETMWTPFSCTSMLQETIAMAKKAIDRLLVSTMNFMAFGISS